MPALYAHKKFGALVYKTLPRDIRRIIADNKQEFLIGLHGPDILFFHLTDAGKAAEAVGHLAHRRPFRVMQKRAYRLAEEKNNEAALSYFFGCICHFVLDSECHPLVDRAVAETGMSHGKIEMELDRYALIMDGEEPLRYPSHAHLPVSMLTAETAARFYKNISAATFRHCMLVMKGVYTAVSSDNDSYRRLITKIMDRVGQSGKVASLMMSRDLSRMAEEHAQLMYEKLLESVQAAEEEIVSFYASVLTGERHFSKRSKKNFYGKLG